MKNQPLTITAFALLPMVTGLAQAQNGLMLEEIVVTAQKREQSMQDVPVAIQSLSGSQIQDAGIDSLAALEQISPSIAMNDGAGLATAYIRGVGSTTASAGTYTSVAVYVDDVYVPRPNSGLFTLNNVDRLEILRGPQGTLYGRNATGGALVVHSKTPYPGDEFEASLEANIGNYDLREYGFQVSGSFGENWAGRISASWIERDGYIDSITPGAPDLDNQDSINVLAKLAWAPTDNLNLVLSGWYDERDESSGFGLQQVNTEQINVGTGLNNPQTLFLGVLANLTCQQVPGCGGPGDILQGPLAPTLIGLSSQLTFPTEFGRTANSNLGGFVTGPSTLGSEKEGDSGSFQYGEDTRISLKIDWSLDGFDVVSITAYTDHTANGSADILAADPGSVVNVLDAIAPGVATGDNLGFSSIFDDTNSFSQELRLQSNSGDLQWLVGAFYFTESGDSLLNADLFGASFRTADNTFDVESIAAFGQITYPISDTVNINFGLRHTEETYELDDHIVDSDPTLLAGIINITTANQIGFPGSPFPDENDYSQTTGSLVVDWALESTLLYAGVNTGFKSGNLNANNPLDGGVDPEEIIAYEVGFKSDLADGRIRLNGAAFFYDYDNIHIQTLNSQTGATTLLNGTAAEVTGAELELEAAIAESLILTAALTVLDTEYTEDVVVPRGGGILPIEGNNLVGAPEAALTLALNYTKNIAQGELRISGNALYSDGYYFDAENRIGSGGNNADSYTIVSGSVGYATDHWEASLWANNLFDEEYYRTGFVANGLSETAVAGAPRTYGLRLKYSF